VPRIDTRDDSFEPFRISPVGARGLDLFSDPALLDPSFLIRADNARMGTMAVERRTGGIKLLHGTANHGSLTFGATTKYALLPAASQLVLPAGGFALFAHFAATWPASGKTGYLISSRPSGETFHVLKVTISDAGVITVSWTDSGATERSVACTAVTDGASVHLLAIYDAPAGTFTVYINGASSGTPLTGLDATLKPDQTTGVAWAFAVEKQTGAAVTADTQFPGAIDSLTLQTLRGSRPASGTTTLASVLRKHSLRRWPTPQADGVVFHYDCDSISTFYDRSRFKNHGSITGTPTLTSAVAYSSVPGQAVHTIQSPTGTRTNVVGIGGTLYYEGVR